MSSEVADRVTGSSDKRPMLAKAVAGFTIAGVAAGLMVTVLDASRGAKGSQPSVFEGLPFLIAFVAFPVVGYILASRRPDNAIGWVLSGVGAIFALDLFLSSYWPYALRGGVGGRTVGSYVAAIESPMWVPIVAVPATFLLLLFPSGHLPSRRWRWFARCLAAALALVFLAIMFGPGEIEQTVVPNLQNSLGIEAIRPVESVFIGLIGFIPVGIFVALISLVLRFRRSTGIERLQLKWLVTAAGGVAALYGLAVPIGVVTGWNTESPTWVQVLQNISIISFALIPIAIGVAVLRYRLFEIDVVINRALLIGALAIFITGIYVAFVIGIGALVGSRANPVLSAAAAAVVAIAFQPARRRAQRLADRLVYGNRATPYEVLSVFSERLGNAYANEELLPRMARALADGTGARADVWVRIGDELRAEATWPQDVEPATAMAVSSNFEESVSASSMLVPVRQDDEVLGALSIRKRQGESVSATEERLVRDLAAQAGLVMRNVALTEQLMENIEQLRASRQRLVAAQDDERRKLERNLHDGAQQQLVAISVKLRLLEQLIGGDEEKARSLAAGLQSDAGAALDELRDLARGIYPPLLADQGLVVALESQARRSVVPVTIEADGVGRYAREVEAAVYFSCLEALQNVAKYAEASRATIHLMDGDGRLQFEVTDDGVGFDPTRTSYGTGLQGVADRLAAIGGEAKVRSNPGAGTTVSGELPVAEPNV